jgi:hypothetical protein
MKTLSIALLALLPAQDKKAEQTDQKPPDRATAIARATAFLETSQAEDGHWGGQYSCAITSMAGLALLASRKSPFESKPLIRAIKWLRAQIKDGRVPKQGHTWVHSQGFATLFLAEVYGRALLSDNDPDLDLPALRKQITKMVAEIEAAQSDIGGWYYTPTKTNHEGSTTVCAVQALRAANNFGVDIDTKVLAKGFEYLKKTQNADGSFQYRLGDGSRMKEGTAAGIATLALMRKLDFPVLIKGGKHLIALESPAISNARFPFYGHFYSVLGMKLVAEEMGAAVKGSDVWHEPVFEWLLSGQRPDGTWKLRGWMLSQGNEGGRHDYSTALGALILSVHDERLSIFRRKPPKLPHA